MNTNNEIVKKRIAIIGGSFDPPTLSHLFIGAELLNQKLCDEIHYIPCGYRSDKDLTNGDLRMKMLNAAINEFFWASKDQVKIDDIEIKNGQIIPTFDLLTTMYKKYPEMDIRFVMGSDLLYHYVNWEYGDLLKTSFKYFIIERAGYTNYPKENIPDDCITVDMPM